VVQLGHNPILGKIHILSVLDLLGEIGIIVIRVTTIRDLGVTFKDLTELVVIGEGRSEGDVRVVLHLFG